MFYQISKLFWYFAEPPSLLALLTLLGLLILRGRWRRYGKVLLGSIVAFVMVLALTPASQILLHGLENRFPEWRDDGKPIDGIIVLGGSISPNIYFEHLASGFNPSTGRIIGTAELAKRYPNARVVYTGGPPDANNQDEAEASRQLLVSLGVDNSRVTLERESLNTFQNAVYSKKMVQPKPGERWLMVTSALHMPRAMGCFRAAGFEVIAAPVDFHVVNWRELTLNDLGILNGLNNFSTVYHEFIGMAVYRLTHKTNEFYPAP